MINPFAPYEYFHFHIYYKNEEEREKAELLSEQLVQYLNGLPNAPVRNAIGPHKYPMIEVDIGKGKNLQDMLHDFSMAVQFCMRYADGLSILIHPLGEEVNPLSAHTTEALWIGDQLPLKLSIFPDYKA